MMFLTYLSMASSQPNDKSSSLTVGRTVQVSCSLKQKPSSGHFLVKLIILVTAGFNSVNPGSLSLPLVPGVVCTSSIAALGGGLWAVHLPCPLLHTGDRRGWWPAVTQFSLIKVPHLHRPLLSTPQAATRPLHPSLRAGMLGWVLTFSPALPPSH